jgi:hypothetical protein
VRSYEACFKIRSSFVCGYQHLIKHISGVENHSHGPQKKKTYNMQTTSSTVCTYYSTFLPERDKRYPGDLRGSKEPLSRGVLYTLYEYNYLSYKNQYGRVLQCYTASYYVSVVNKDDSSTVAGSFRTFRLFFCTGYCELTLTLCSPFTPSPSRKTPCG